LSTFKTLDEIAAGQKTREMTRRMRAATGGYHCRFRADDFLGAPKLVGRP
jgi:hypothetical protein